MIRNLLAAKNLKTAAALSGLLVAGLAHAGCGDAPVPAGKQHSSTRSSPAVYRSDGLVRTAFVTVGDQWFEDASIVGLWEFEVRLNGAQNGLPDGFLFDWGLAMWHEDGTEMQFSAGRPPSSGDVCMGVYRASGRNKFKMHHVALGLSPPQAGAAGTYAGPAIIEVVATVDRSGDNYTGSYTLTQFPGSPEDGTEFNEKGTPLAVFNATITAHRVTVK